MSKASRNKVACANYKVSGTREKNKAYKVLRHLERHPTCKAAQGALERLGDTYATAARKKLSKLRKETERGLTTC